MIEEQEEHQIKHETIIRVKNVSKNFPVGKNSFPALKNINFDVKSTDFIVIYGPSGCGKSTLFNVILGLENPTHGEVSVRGTKIYDLDDDQRGKFRINKIGMVYQMSNWIKSLNVVENVAFPLIVSGVKQGDAIRRAHKTLAELHMGNLAKQIPTELSGGEQQRVGIARALVSNPWIIMADEPTGNLDTSTSDLVMALFNTLNVKMRKTIILVTHNSAYWDMGTRRIEMRDGEIIKDTEHR